VTAALLAAVLLLLAPGGGASATCPRALEPGPRAPEGVLAAVRQGVPGIYRGPEYRGYLVTGLAPLAPRAFRPAGVDVYAGIAARRCGRRVADRSWVVFLTFPRAPGASISQGIVFTARTATGWRLWYRYR
jgi:hypothetical protein